MPKKGFESLRSNREKRRKNPFELHERFVVKNNAVDMVDGYAAFVEAIGDGGRWEACVVLLPRETFFLGGGDYIAVAH